MLREFIGERMALAMDKAKQDPRYIKYHEQQVKSQQLADAILEKMVKEDRLTIRRSNEDEIASIGLEMEEIYIQGLRDGVKLLSILEVVDMKVEL